MIKSFIIIHLTMNIFSILKLLSKAVNSVFLPFLRATADTAMVRLSHLNYVCLSVCPSHGWISQKRCKL